MDDWAVLFGVIGALGGLAALADRLRKRGQQDAGLAFEGMTTLASELRHELDRKAKAWADDLKAERDECDQKISGLERRLKAVEEANGI